jgi:hypothetical protein
MDIEFITTLAFEKSYKRLKKKYISLKDDLAELKEELSENPTIGADLGGGVRKIRMAIKSKNSGKSGGARMITYDLCVQKQENIILLVDIYDKSEIETLHENEYKLIIEKFLAEE